MKPSRLSERGGVLVWILIAVALFGALSYAMMRDSGTGAATRTMSDVQARLHATELIAFADSVRQAVQKLRIRGCAEDQISFANDAYVFMTNGNPISPEGHNPRAPADGTCDIFKPAGGGLRPLRMPQSALRFVVGNGWKEDAFGIQAAAVTGVGSDAAKEVVMHGGQLTKEVCMTVNIMLGVDNPSGDAPLELQVDTYPGGYPAHLYVSPPGYFGNEDPSLAGKPAACYKRIGDGTYVFYKVVIAR